MQQLHGLFAINRVLTNSYAAGSQLSGSCESPWIYPCLKANTKTEVGTTPVLVLVLVLMRWWRRIKPMMTKMQTTSKVARTISITNTVELDWDDPDTVSLGPAIITYDSTKSPMSVNTPKSVFGRSMEGCKYTHYTLITLPLKSSLGVWDATSSLAVLGAEPPPPSRKSITRKRVHVATDFGSLCRYLNQENNTTGCFEIFSKFAAH